MTLINNIQSDILEQLGRFAFLSVSQIKYITNKSLGYLREQLGILVQRKLISSYRVEITAKVRAENIYFLLPAGKEVLLHNHKVFAGDIRLPIGTPHIIRDYHHRKSYVNIHIALYQHLKQVGSHIAVFHSYFDKTGNNRTAHNLEAKTKIPLGERNFFISDGVMITESSEGKKLYLLEMYNGKDTIRTLQQLAKHAQAIAAGAPGKAWDIPANPSVLSVFEYDSSKQAVMKRLQDNKGFEPFRALFFFASLDDVRNKVGTAFTTITNTSLVLV